MTKAVRSVLRRGWYADEMSRLHAYQGGGLGGRVAYCGYAAQGLLIRRQARIDLPAPRPGQCEECFWALRREVIREQAEQPLERMSRRPRKSERVADAPLFPGLHQHQAPEG